MNARNLVSTAAAAGPALPTIAKALATYAPPVLIGFGVAALVLWMFEDDKKEKANARPASEESNGGNPALDSIPGVRDCRHKRDRRPAPFPPVRHDTDRVTGPGTVASGRSRVEVETERGEAVIADLPTPALTSPAINEFGDAAASATEPVSTAKERTTSGKFARKLTVEAVAAVFANGPLTRNQAVAALIANGVSRSRAYDALKESGIFAINLVFDQNGVISWQ